MTIFGDPFELTRPDPLHSEDEDRFLSVGLSSSNRLLLVSYAERGKRLRLISARQVSSQEKKQYESRRP
ncbi:MAG TPA: BrnT family toxin [Thermoanaerobaculia bacterium]|nr:BrnT family toxin [Thermoanaerobaculia bacterium]